MMRYRTSVDAQGRIEIPEELRRSIGWGEHQWYVADNTDGGIRFRMVDRPEAAEALHEILEANLVPLGEGRGEKHNQYVSRWRHGSGAVLVNENGQPNIWMTRETASRLDAETVPGQRFDFVPGDGKPGFHSNVASTPGLKGKPVVKFRAESTTQARAMGQAILSQLKRVP